jgi:hypothetical protein
MKLEHIDHKPSHTAPIPAFDFLFAAPEKRPAAVAPRRSWLGRALSTRRS